MLKKENKYKRIAFVASTLPIQFIIKNDLNIEEIFIALKSLKEPYKFLSNKIPKVKMFLIPENIFLHSLFLLYKIFLARLFSQEILFFHECCWPIFDLFVKIMKPKGVYCPQVTMSSFSPVLFDDLKLKSRTKELIAKYVFMKYFILYRVKDDGGKKYNYVWALRKYPSSIKTLPTTYSFTVKGKTSIGKSDDVKIEQNKRILFLTGREPVRDNSISCLYEMLCKIAQINGYRVALKDHPNPTSRINLKLDDCEIINPAQPAELLEESFDFIVGVASTALLAFQGKAISIINLLTEMSIEEKRKRYSHLLNLPGGNKIISIKTLEEFEAILMDSQKVLH